MTLDAVKGEMVGVNVYDHNGRLVTNVATIDTGACAVRIFGREDKVNAHGWSFTMADGQKIIMVDFSQSLH